MKRIVLVLAAAILALCLSGCGKPADMDQVTYDCAQEAIQVGENYLSGKTSANDAYAKFERLYDKLDSYIPDNSHNHTLVSSTVLHMKLETSGLWEPDDAEIAESIEDLRRYCS